MNHGIGILRNNMKEKIILITGANGEIGQELIKTLSENKKNKLITLDLQPIINNIRKFIHEEITGDILYKNLLKKINDKYTIDEIYHLAALLSTRSEQSPYIAHEVNVNGTLNMITLGINQSKKQNNEIKFFFPSSIAIYGLRNSNIKKAAGAIEEKDYCEPITIYGCNKLYCEKLGLYYSNHFNQLAENSPLDFRSIRFSGLISNVTEPQGGTSDYIPEMLHAAARGETYECFVNENTKMPFMTMDDAVDSIIQLMNVEKINISSKIYHLSTFNPSPKEFYDLLIEYFPNFKIKYIVNEKRQKMVDSWPMDLNCNKAKNEWNWKPKNNLQSAIHNYLIPGIKKLYNT